MKINLNYLKVEKFKVLSEKKYRFLSGEVKTKVNISQCIRFFFVALAINMCLGTSISFANNLTLGSTISIVSGDQISFTIKWDNSWYVSTAPNNWDAVWIFVKYKDCATTNWQHAPLSTVLADHSISGGSGLLSIEMPAVNDGKGVFIRRTAIGSGNISNAETITLKLNGIATGNYNFQVFGIEMVKVLKEDFQVGDGVSNNTFKSIVIDSTYQASGVTGSVLGGGASDLPAAYPMGYNDFYCMKYEITQEQYVDFLNTLTYDQQKSRTYIAPSSMAGNFALSTDPFPSYPNPVNVNFVKIKTAGYDNTTPAVYACDYDNDNNYNETNDGQNIPCNYLTVSDLWAYLDWAALRPMSDLEFEKICRGPLGRIAGEYPWGSVALTQASSVVNAGQAGEKASASGPGLCTYRMSVWSIESRLIRVGYAATASTDRLSAGAAYYGALDMAGNVWERVMSVSATGVGFKGTLGDGSINSTGNYTNSDWATTGSGLRGGSFDLFTDKDGGGNSHTENYFKTSGRIWATTVNNGRSYRFGGRGVR